MPFGIRIVLLLFSEGFLIFCAELTDGISSWAPLLGVDIHRAIFLADASASTRCLNTCALTLAISLIINAAYHFISFTCDLKPLATSQILFISGRGLIV